MLNLNGAQRRAVMHGEGPLLVLAGPGSGKTHVITQRILYLIEAMNVPPEEILVITFTKEAALSMQHRFKELCTQNYPVVFGTFHSVFYHILRTVNPSRAKAIWGESQKKNLIISFLKRTDKKADSEDTSTFLAAISFYKNTGDMEGALDKLSPENRNFFTDIFAAYEERRRKECAIDFDDMVYECADVLANNIDARSTWNRRFSHILMDEFQDINPMQYQVIKLLSAKPYNLFAVGDDDQAIYGFRGSNPDCMKKFVSEFSAKEILLNVNYRSCKEIVDASLRVIETNKNRFLKKIVPCQENMEKAEKANLKDVVGIHFFAEKEEQYAYLIEKIEASLKNDECGKENLCAVLFRTNMYMQGFAARLNRKGIPYEMKEKAKSIYEHFIVKDIMAYLRIAAGEESKSLYLQILNKPARFISREALYYNNECPSGKRTQNMKEFYLNQALAFDAKGISRTRALEAILLLEKQLDNLKEMSLYPAVQYICKFIGYEAYLTEAHEKHNCRPERLEEYQRILEFIKEDAKVYGNLKEWIKAQEQFKDKCSNDKDNILKESDTPKVHLMTVHASKGLEFDRVYIPDCNEKVFPYGRMPDKEACEEECRIFYVAMTRAKKSLELLYLTGTKERPRLPSRFLNPLL